MKVEVVNKTKRLRVQVAIGIPASTARQMVDEMSVAVINELAHYKAGDKVEVTVSGGNPTKVIYRRTL